jgi:hypothetical protein
MMDSFSSATSTLQNVLENVNKRGRFSINRKQARVIPKFWWVWIKLLSNQPKPSTDGIMARTGARTYAAAAS